MNKELQNCKFVVNKKMVDFCWFVLWTLIFSIGYTQFPLYSGNQHPYFLHGLANAGMGFLQSDWLANTIDPFPFFSIIIELTYLYLHEYMFYLYQIIFLGIFLYFVFGIASHVVNISKYSEKYICFHITIISLFSATFVYFSPWINDIGIGWHLQAGVAGQHVLGWFFQPSVFGVFLIASIFFFLKKKPFWATFCAVVAATFHPTYLLSAATLTFSYMIVITVKNRDIKKALFIGVFAIFIIMPILSYTFLFMGPTSDVAWATSRKILAEIRLPSHALPERWMDITVLFKATLILIALYICRNTRLFLVLSICFTVSILLSIVQIILGSYSLALIFPWRLSVFLVPISTAIIIAYIIDIIGNKYRSKIINHKYPLRIFAIVVIIIVLTGGIVRQIRLFRKYYKEDTSIEMLNFVKRQKNKNNKYIIPISIEKFRLYTGAPIFISYGSHPYRDLEVVEWYDRILIAKEFYNNREIKQTLLENIRDKFGVNCLVVRYSGKNIKSPILQEIYGDEYYIVFKIAAK